MSRTVLEWTSPHGPAVTHVRSSLILSSLSMLRERGVYSRYCELLDPAFRYEILQNVSSRWVPIGAGLAHYQACDGLGLSTEELCEIGENVSQRVIGAYFGAVVRQTRHLGMNPWITVRSLDTAMPRVFLGGGIRVVEDGPKDAIVVCTGCALARKRYFSIAFRGWIKGVILLFSRTAHVRQIAAEGDDLAYLVRWV